MSSVAVRGDPQLTRTRPAGGPLGFSLVLDGCQNILVTLYLKGKFLAVELLEQTKCNILVYVAKLLSRAVSSGFAPLYLHQWWSSDPCWRWALRWSLSKMQTP